MLEKKEILEILKNYQKPVLGIAVSAWTRSGPLFLLPNYHIISLLETADLGAIRKKCAVKSLQKSFKIEISSLRKKNTASILKQEKIRKYLKSLGSQISLLVYKSSKKVEKVCSRLGIKILANPSEIRDPFEDKKEFRILAKKAGLKLIPGETLLLKNFDLNKYYLMKKKYGKKLVFQLPDYKVGGGIGTFFIDNEFCLKEALSFIQRRQKKGKKLVWLNVTKKIEGIAASICSCITKYGILCGLVQTQLIDIPQARAFKGRAGVWVGHDWVWKTFSFRIQKKAEKIAKTLGQYMYKVGYRGMFGIDLVIDEKKEEVYPVECNARYTGGFPAYSMMQLAAKEIPFDAFHLAEFLNLDYEIDLDKLQKQYRKPKIGAHLVLHNQERKWVRVGGSLKGGVYALEKKELVWKRPGFSLQDIKKEDEFVLCDRCPLKGAILKAGDRLARLLFKKAIAVSDKNLFSEIGKICQKIYQRYKLEKI